MISLLTVLPHLISNLAGLIIPPTFQILKQKICPGVNSPQATLSNLAANDPEVLPKYIDAQAKLLASNVQYFNRDVVGEVSLWVRNLRASIRPLYIVFGITYFLLVTFFALKGIPAIVYSVEITTSSWFGTKIFK